MSQSESRQVLENQKVLTRVQEMGLRHVWYPVEQVQRLLDLLTGGREPRPSHDGGMMG